MKSLLNILLVFFLLGCKEENDSEKLFQLLSPDHTGVTFENTLVPSVENSIFEYEYFFNGGGVGAGDFNNDGLTDLFFSGNQVSSALYLNRGDLKFEDVTKHAGIETVSWCTGVAVVDINQDGWQDIYISHAGLNRTPNQLFINLGNQEDKSVRFSEQAKEYGLDFEGYTTQAAFFDFDRDGDIDVYLLNHNQATSNLNFPKNKLNDATDPSTDRLYRNDTDSAGKVKFTDVTKSAGITMEGFGLGIAVCDINQDGWDDIYVSNDFVFDDLLYINNKNGTFSESGKKYLRHTSRFSMGCDVADFNNDSYQDIVVLDMLPDDNRRQKIMNPATNNDLFNYSLKQGYLPQYTRNMLQLNNGPDGNGDYSFSEIGQLAGIYKTDWSWSPLLADFDNDGWKDLFVSNGIPKDVTNHDFLKYKHVQNKQFNDPKALKRELLERLMEMENIDKPNFIFQNNKDLTFNDVSKAWGLDRRSFSNGSIYADLDNDGDLDLVTNNINATPFIFKNKTSETLKNNFLRLRLTGRYSEGAGVRLVSNNNEQFYYCHFQKGFQSSQENIVHFGVGKENLIDTVEIRWQDGKSKVLTKVAVNQLLVVNYSKADTSVSDFSFGERRSGGETFFKEVFSPSGLSFFHKENDVEDFNFESLLPHRFSTNGPYLCTGDVDKNGFEDLWIGGAAGIPGRVFLQMSQKKFKEVLLPDSEYEDMGALLFDADGDDDLDLYVVSGGNEYEKSSTFYQDRLYLNDGRGNFSKKIGAVPEENVSGSCVTGFDYDKDGDIDLLVGGRLQVGKYPFPSQSFILRNNGKGEFENVTNAVCPKLNSFGMVSSALWTDFDGDGAVDFIVAGEWSEVAFFRNVNGQFIKVQTGLENEKGWWFSLASGDFDGDGDIDFIAGNLGQNSKLKASHELPVSVYAKDFLGNGKIHSILTCHIQGKEYPIAHRDQIGEQIPSIRGRFKTYEDFGNATITDILPPEEVKDALKLSVTNFNSVFIENKGNLKFSIKALPVEAQVSPIQSILIKDFNHDGKLDLVVGGNFYGPDFMTGRYDASIGLLLLGDNKGNFKPVKAQKSGIHFKGDLRNLTLIKIGSKDLIAAAHNKGELQLFELQKP